MHHSCSSKFKAFIAVIALYVLTVYCIFVFLGSAPFDYIFTLDHPLNLITLVGAIFFMPIYLFIFYRGFKEWFERRKHLATRRAELDKEFNYWYKQVEREFKDDISKLKMAHQIKQDYFKTKSRQDIEEMQLILNRIRSLK